MFKDLCVQIQYIYRLSQLPQIVTASIRECKNVTSKLDLIGITAESKLRDFF